MKRLMTFALVALLSLGVASMSLAQGQAAGAGETGGKAPKEHKTHKKSGKKHKKKPSQPAAETTK